MDGIAGIYSPGDSELVHNIFLATGACQHRGKASAGIAIGNGKGIHIHNGLGRIGDVVNPKIMRAFQDLSPVAAIGNVGYTKNKYASEINAEPLEIHPKNPSKYQLVLTLDGYLVKEDDLKAELGNEYTFETGNKTEVIGALLHKYLREEGISFNACEKLVDKLHGRATFALAALVHDGNQTSMIALNDDRAFEPFCYGTIGDAFVVSSESCSQRRLGGFMDREYDGAEMTIISERGIETKRLREETLMPDIFQGVYFGNVGSLFRGKEILQLRRELGLGLVEHYKTSKADIVIPNPESGWGVSVGIADGLEKKLRPALVKLAQAVRTFQEGQSRTRSREVGLKFGGIDSMLKDKNVAMGDDSIVRGSVSEGGSVWVVFNSGAKSLEFWVSYGPMFFPSFKEWHRGMECFEELAAQRAFKGDNPYDKKHDEINQAVKNLIIGKLKEGGISNPDFEVKYNLQEIIRKAAGDGSFQALDASYPISEEFWPDFIKVEVEKFHKYRRS